MDEKRDDQNFGLTHRDLNYFRISLTRIPEIEQAFIFGSRAMGDYFTQTDPPISVIIDPPPYRWI